MHAFRLKAICSTCGALLLLPLISAPAHEECEPAPASCNASDRHREHPHPLHELDATAASTGAFAITVTTEALPPGSQPRVNSVGWLPGFGHNHYASVAQTAPLYLFRGAADLPDQSEMPLLEHATTLSVVGPVHLGDVALTAHVQGQVNASTQTQST